MRGPSLRSGRPSKRNILSAGAMALRATTGRGNCLWHRPAGLFPHQRRTSLRDCPRGHRPALLVFFPTAETHADRRAGEAEVLTELVLQIAPVGEVDLRGIVDEEDERRRRDV